jgi:hypothetical protein
MITARTHAHPRPRHARTEPAGQPARTHAPPTPQARTHRAGQPSQARTPHPCPNQPASAKPARGPPGNRRPRTPPFCPPLDLCPYPLLSDPLSRFLSIPAIAISSRRLRRRGGLAAAWVSGGASRSQSVRAPSSSLPRAPPAF